MNPKKGRAGRATQGAPRTSRRLREGPPTGETKTRSQGIEVRDRWEGDPTESPGKGSWFVVVGCCFLLFVVVWCCLLLLFVVVWVYICLCGCCCSCSCWLWLLLLLLLLLLFLLFLLLLLLLLLLLVLLLLLLLNAAAGAAAAASHACWLLQVCLLAAASPFLPSSSLTRSPLRRPGSADIYIYMMVDLKVLVRSFNCESRACYVGNPRESFFFEFAKVKFCFAKVSRKLDILIVICKGLPPTAAQGLAGEGHQRMRVAVAKFPKVRLCESQTPRPLVFVFPSVHPLLMAAGSVGIGIFSRKFRESYAKERAKVKVHVEGGGPVNFAKNHCPEKGFRDASWHV